MKITICRKAHFNAAHKLYNPALSNDENFEIFSTLKSKKMVTTIPALLCFYGNSDRNNWFASDMSLSSSNPIDVDNFFTKIKGQISFI